MATSYRINRQRHKVAMREQDPVVRVSNFEEVTLGYTKEEAVSEARRCLQCSDAPCISGCPVGVPIPRVLDRIAQGDFGSAYAIVKNANSLPAICGRVCPQERQCECVCMRGRKGEPVGIGRLERFVADWAFENPSDVDAASRPVCDFGDSALKKLAGKRVACAGSGPASLTCAGELAKMGADVTVFEAFHEVGGVLIYGIPEFRLPKSLVAREISTLAQNGIHFELNSLVGRLYSIDELMDEWGFDAVFVGAGAGVPSYLGIEGEGLNGVMLANDLLTRVNLMKAYRFPEYETPVYMGKKCIVVGGGNVAIDAARTAKRLGADVTVVYRRGREEMPARAEEICYAEQEGIEFQLLASPVRVIGDDLGWVTGLECVRMELGDFDTGGRRRSEKIEGSEFVKDIDTLIVAVGSKTNPLIAQTTPGLEVTPQNFVIVDKETGATSKAGVFAGGDTVSGAATVILAMGAGKRAAFGIADYLTNV